MGVWGAGPFDNDTAGNMVGKMMEPIHRVLDLPLDLPLSVPRKNRHRGKGLRHIASDYYDEARVSAAFILLAHGTDVLGGPHLQPVLDALKKMRSDDDWLNSWDRNPLYGRELRCAIDKQIRAVQRKIRICCRKRTRSVRRPGRTVSQ